MTMPPPAPSRDEVALATALSDFHRRQSQGEAASPARYREALGDLYPEFQELVAVEGVLDQSLEAARTPALPRVFGRYTFTAQLGRGGMGTVFLADDQKLGRQVAVKVLHGGFAHADPGLRRRFLQEAHLCGTIRDDHIVAIHDADEHEGELFFVMDVVPGESLADRLRRGERPAHAELARGLRDVARALHKVHAASIVHRDVKPGNILITPEGKYVLTDFGLARRLEGTRVTRSGQLLGTLPYMSPGQLRGAPDAATPASDVYGLGAVLYEALTGRLPFSDADSDALLDRILHDRPARPRDLDPAIPRGLEAIALRALEKRPGDRPPTAAALADELEVWLEGGTPRPPPSRASRVLRAARENVLALASAALLLVGGALLLAQWLATRPGHVQVHAPYDEDLLAEVDVLLDGREVGRSGREPLRLELPPGRYVFAAQAPGFGLREDTWHVEAGATSMLRLYLGKVVDPARVEAWRTWLKALRAEPVSSSRSGAFVPPPLYVLAPSGDVRPADLARGWCLNLEAGTDGGTLTLRRGAEVLWSAPFARGGALALARGAFPDRVLAGLRPGDRLAFAWTPADGSGGASSEARVVEAPEAEDAQRRIARLLDPQLELTGRLAAESWLGHGLACAALDASLEHVRRFPGDPAAWTLLQAVVGRLDRRALLIDDIDAHLAHGHPAPALPAARRR
jgi:hypothetical protein